MDDVENICDLFCDTIEFCGNIFGSLCKFISSLCQNLWKLIEFIVEKLTPILRPCYNAIKQCLEVIFKYIVDCCVSLFKNIIVPIYDCLAKVCDKVFSCFKNMCKVMFENCIKHFCNFLDKLCTCFFRVFAEIAGYFWQYCFKCVFETIVEFFTGIFLFFAQIIGQIVIFLCDILFYMLDGVCQCMCKCDTKYLQCENFIQHRVQCVNLCPRFLNLMKQCCVNWFKTWFQCLSELGKLFIRFLCCQIRCLCCSDSIYWVNLDYYNNSSQGGSGNNQNNKQKQKQKPKEQNLQQINQENQIPNDALALNITTDPINNVQPNINTLIVGGVLMQNQQYGTETQMTDQCYDGKNNFKQIISVQNNNGQILNLTVEKQLSQANSQKHLLILQGGPFQSSNMLKQYLKLDNTDIAKYYIDFPSGMDSKIWNMQNLVIILDNLRIKLGLNNNNFYIYGHHFGVILALEYAQQYSQNLKGLILSNMMFSVPIYNQHILNNIINGLPQGSLTKHTINREEKLGNFSQKEYQAIYLDFVERYQYGQQLDQVQKNKIIGELFDQSNKQIKNKIWGDSNFYIKGELSEWDGRNILAFLDIPILIIASQNDYMDNRHILEASMAIQKREYLFCQNSGNYSFIMDQQVVEQKISNFINQTSQDMIQVL